MARATSLPPLTSSEPPSQKSFWTSVTITALRTCPIVRRRRPPGRALGPVAREVSEVSAVVAGAVALERGEVATYGLDAVGLSPLPPASDRTEAVFG